MYLTLLLLAIICTTALGLRVKAGVKTQVVSRSQLRHAIKAGLKTRGSNGKGDEDEDEGDGKGDDEEEGDGKGEEDNDDGKGPKECGDGTLYSTEAEAETCPDGKFEECEDEFGAKLYECDHEEEGEGFDFGFGDNNGTISDFGNNSTNGTIPLDDLGEDISNTTAGGDGEVSTPPALG